MNGSVRINFGKKGLMYKDFESSSDLKDLLQFINDKYQHLIDNRKNRFRVTVIINNKNK